MDARVRQFRRRRRSGKCPKDERALAVGYARERVAEGKSAETAARELGVGCSTMDRWLRDSSSSVGRQWELPGAVGVQWELRGAVVRRDQSQALGFFLNPGP
jgi:hypothetical protein